MHISAQHPLTNCQPAAQTTATSSGGIVGWLAHALHNWRERSADLRELALMDERALRDARLTRWEVEQELNRPFWRD